MRAVIQRVSEGSVTLKDTGERRSIGGGLVALIAVAPDDTEAEAEWLADKIVGLRIFEDEDSKMNRSLNEMQGEMLIVSQFTLYADTRKGRRPSLTGAAAPAQAVPIYEKFVTLVRNKGVPTETGEFGADMVVAIVNDGPVTLIVETPSRSREHAR